MKREIFFRTTLLFTVSASLFLAACKPKNEPISPPATSKGSTNVGATDATHSSEATSDTPSVAAKTSGITGKIILQGTPPPEKDILMDASGKLHLTPPKTRFYVVGQGGELADVFIYIKEGLSGKTFPDSAAPVLLDQVSCEYTPYVVGLQTKQKLLVRNSDPMMHNVHSMPKISPNKEFNKAQMAKSPDLQYSFETPEIFVTFKCNVHPWMYAYVGVVEHPFFAVSGKSGNFQLKNVPDGKYVVEAIHRKAGKQTKEVTISGGESKPINFTFTLLP